MVKKPPASAGNVRNVGLIPGSGRSLGEGNGNPLQYSCLENSMDRGAWRAIVHGVTRNYMQCPIINHNGEEYEKEYMHIYIYLWASLVAQLVKNLPAMQETPV